MLFWQQLKLLQSEGQRVEDGPFHMVHYFPAVRFDHLSVLCELMPVALPSLAACLQTLSHGHFSPEALSKVTEQLGISSVEVEAIVR